MHDAIKAYLAEHAKDRFADDAERKCPGSGHDACWFFSLSGALRPILVSFLELKPEEANKLIMYLYQVRFDERKDWKIAKPLWLK